MSPEEYLAFTEPLIQEVRLLKKHISSAYDTTMGYVPEKVRPIEPRDVCEGKIVFGKNSDGWYWHQIEEVHNSRDDWKAYTASDGCRYGLSGLFVRDE